LGRHPGQEPGNPGTDVAVKLKIGRKYHDGIVSEDLPILENGRAHRYIEGFGLVAAGDNATVIAAEDDDGPRRQVGSKKPFAADEEIIAVDESEGSGHSNPLGAIKYE